MFLVIVYSYSKYVEVFPVSNSTSQTTINCLKTCFGTHGLPQICVSENGSCFTSEEFERFMKGNGILHIKSAPLSNLASYPTLSLFFVFLLQ